MSVSSIGDSAAHVWQQLQDSRTNSINPGAQFGSGATTSPSAVGTSAGSAPPLGTPPASSPGASHPTSSAGSVSDAAAKVVADLKSFFLTLQSENGLGSTGTPTTDTTVISA